MGEARRRPAARIGVAVLAVATVGAGTAVVVAQNRDWHVDATTSGVPTSTATVVRTDLATTIQVNGTLGYADSSLVANEANGIYTALPAIGAVIGRGQTLYEVDGQPIVLWYGSRPAWRALGPGVTDGPDVSQLKQNLVALGFLHTANAHYDTATYLAVRRWQASVGVPVNGTVGPGDVVYAAGPIRVAGLHAALGDPARPGTLVDATGTEPIVNLSVPVTQQYLAKVGDVVRVTLPDGTTTVAGTITSVSQVATSGGDGQPATTANPGAGGNGPAAVNVTVRLANPAAVASFNQAPVVVNITDQSVHGVLAVPINALVALAEGGYGVWLLDHGARRLVGVRAGLFSDTLVQVTGVGITAGMTVEVPSS